MPPIGVGIPWPFPSKDVQITPEEAPLVHLAMVDKRMPYIGPELVSNLGAANYRRMDLWE